ncbi:MAG: carbohydrate-binding family V/XII, partial [Gemmatimonadetes bacterium]|nr:carbohydrate-binding family V/XII [Gemmatimonadota bacterium]
MTPAALTLAVVGGPPQQVAEDPGWPREIRVGTATILMYQPQPESFEGNMLSARAAISVERSEGAELQFGAVWITSRVETDRDTRIVRVLDATVNRVRFPEAAMDQEQTLADLLEREIPRWDLRVSLDRLLTSIELEEERVAATDLRATPPRVIVATTPSVLVSIDGEPRLQPIENSSYMRVINTPFTIILSPTTRTYYLHTGGEAWYTTDDIVGEWALTQTVPPDVAALAPQQPADAIASESDSIPSEPGPPPAIVVATEPTELIVMEGDLEYTPISGTDLLYVANTASDVLLEIGEQRYYIILSGRWYASESLTGTWTHVPPDSLPATFGQIPPESEMGHLLLSVPDTEAANEAVLDAQIPQTAAVSRSESHLEVTYDGEPRFEPIEGTEMAYAANTSSSVVKVGETYYACEEAVWFVADNPHGPWLVADRIAEEISTIPPSAPVYNVTYVHVYNSTPDVVYVGYYPGYMHSYVYGGTIVYGTGYYYNPW